LGLVERAFRRGLAGLPGWLARSIERAVERDLRELEVLGVCWDGERVVIRCRDASGDELEVEGSRDGVDSEATGLTAIAAVILAERRGLLGKEEARVLAEGVVRSLARWADSVPDFTRHHIYGIGGREMRLKPEPRISESPADDIIMIGLTAFRERNGTCEWAILIPAEAEVELEGEIDLSSLRKILRALEDEDE